MVNENRTNIIHFAVTNEELEAIKRKMEACGIRNLSAFLRKQVLEGYVLKVDYAQIHELVRLLGNMTNNINQISARLNASGKIYDSDFEEIDNNQQTIMMMLRQLLGFLMPKDKKGRKLK